MEGINYAINCRALGQSHSQSDDDVKNGQIQFYMDDEDENGNDRHESMSMTDDPLSLTSTKVKREVFVKKEEEDEIEVKEEDLTFYNSNTQLSPLSSEEEIKIENEMEDEIVKEEVNVSRIEEREIESEDESQKYSFKFDPKMQDTNAFVTTKYYFKKLTKNTKKKKLIPNKNNKNKSFAVKTVEQYMDKILKLISKADEIRRKAIQNDPNFLTKYKIKNDQNTNIKKKIKLLKDFNLKKVNWWKIKRFLDSQIENARNLLSIQCPICRFLFKPSNLKAHTKWMHPADNSEKVKNELETKDNEDTEVMSEMEIENDPEVTEIPKNRKLPYKKKILGLLKVADENRREIVEKYPHLRTKYDIKMNQENDNDENLQNLQNLIITKKLKFLQKLHEDYKFRWIMTRTHLIFQIEKSKDPDSIHCPLCTFLFCPDGLKRHITLKHKDYKIEFSSSKIQERVKVIEKDKVVMFSPSEPYLDLNTQSDEDDNEYRDDSSKSEQENAITELIEEIENIRKELNEINPDLIKDPIIPISDKLRYLKEYSNRIETQRKFLCDQKSNAKLFLTYLPCPICGFFYTKNSITNNIHAKKHHNYNAS